MDKKNASDSTPNSDRERDSRLLYFLGRLWLKGIKGKLTLGVTGLAAVSSSVVCGAIYLGVAARLSQMSLSADWQFSSRRR